MSGTIQNMGEEGFRWFTGVVENLDDPQKLGRVKVRVVNLHDAELTSEDIPWAVVMMPCSSASVDQKGNSPTGLVQGSTVIGFFLDGQGGQFPVVMGTFHKIPRNDPTQHDVNKLARGENKIRKTVVGPEPTTAYAAQYPFNQVFESRSGHIVEIDDTSAHERLHVYHKSGSYVEINEKGRMVTKVVDEDMNVVIKDKTIYVHGGDIKIVANKGSITIDGAQDVNIVSRSEINLLAPKVNINP